MADYTENSRPLFLNSNQQIVKMADQEILNLTDEEVVKAYISNPKNKEMHVAMAYTLKEIFKDKWFRVKEINQKTGVKSSREAARMMVGLQLFGLCTARDYKGIAQFKIILTVEEKLKVLEGHKQNHIKQIELLNQEIEKLKSEVEIEK